MKTKGNPKKNFLPEGDKFDRKRAKQKSTNKSKGSKRKLSIYDEFEDMDADLDYYNDDMDDSLDD